MALVNVKLTGTTDGSGDVTINAPNSIYGFLYAIEWVFGSGTSGVDATFTMQSTPSGVAKTLLTLTNANADAWYHPRDDEHGSTGTASGGKCYPLLVGIPRLVIAQGGSAKTYVAVLHYFRIE